MSKTLAKYDFYGEFKNHQKALKILGKSTRVTAKLLEIEGAISKTSREIDEEVILAFGYESPEELNGLQISDPLNHYLLVRQNGVWNNVYSGGQVVTSLPISPVDGEIVYYQNAAMAAEGVVWQLRYRAASASIHKWEFVGGSTLTAGILGDITTSESASFVSMTSGPEIVLPLSGEYKMEISLTIVISGAGYALAYVFVGSTETQTQALIDAPSALQYLVNGQSAVHAGTSGEKMNIRVKSLSGVSTRYVNATIRAIPVRVG